MSTAHPVPDPASAGLAGACVREALVVIGEAGLEALSIREVARRLGVSHQAPYKHFPSRDHLVAEVVGQAFADFAVHLDAHSQGGGPHEDLDRMGVAYLAYARTQPLRYHLMFGATLPDPHAHPSMLQRARHAFELLRQALARLPDHTGADAAAIDAAALFVWSTLHGLASLQAGHALQSLHIAPQVLAALPSPVMAHISTGLVIPSTAPGRRAGVTAVEPGTTQ